MQLVFDCLTDNKYGRYAYDNVRSRYMTTTVHKGKGLQEFLTILLLFAEH